MIKTKSKSSVFKLPPRQERSADDITDDIEKKAEAPAGAPLGRIAFAQDRHDVPSEPNTEEEDDIYDDIFRHVVDNEHFSTFSANKIKKLMSKNLYPNMFKEPVSSPVYRGMAVSTEWLAKALKLNKQALQKLNKGGHVEKNFTFTPYKSEASSSWTDVIKTAKKFAIEGPQEVPIILHAYVESNKGKFLDLKAKNGNGIYSLDNIQGYDKEREVIGLGKIKVFKIVWLAHRAW